jgi:hypothetical protein
MSQNDKIWGATMVHKHNHYFRLGSPQAFILDEEW